MAYYQSTPQAAAITGLASAINPRRLYLLGKSQALPATMQAAQDKEYADREQAYNEQQLAYQDEANKIEQEANTINQQGLQLQQQQQQDARKDARIATGLGIAKTAADIYGGYQTNKALQGILGQKMGDTATTALSGTTTTGAGLFDKIVTPTNIGLATAGGLAGYGLGKAVGGTKKAGLIGAGVGAVAAPLAYNYGPDLFKGAVGSVIGAGKDIYETISGWFS